MSSVEELLIMQTNATIDLAKFKKNFYKSKKELLAKTSYLNGRLALLESMMTIFKANHIKVSYLVKVEDVTKANDEYFTEDFNEKFQDLYLELQSDIVDKINVLNSAKTIAGDKCSVQCPVSAHSNIEGQGIHLPNISLPEFDGNYKNWMDFHDLYIGMIHNQPNLPKEQKLYYLKQCLSGDARDLLNSVKCTADNYDSAWKSLSDRFHKKRFIVEAYLKTLCEQPSLHKESSVEIRKLLDTTKDCLTSIQNLNVSIKSWDVLIIFILTQKLDFQSRKNWERFLTSKNAQREALKADTYELPQLDDFYEFLDDSFRSLEAIDNKIALFSSDRKEKTTTNNKKPIHVRTYHTLNNNSPCLCCSEPHYLYKCMKFKSLSYEERISFIKSKNLCLNCLVQGHTAPKCRSKLTCRKCNKRHHTLIHPEHIDIITNEPSTSQNAASTSSQSQSHSHILVSTNSVSSVSEILLATACVKISSHCGELILRALIDQGSQTSFITENCVQRLRLKKTPLHCTVSGIGATSTKLCKSAVEFNLCSCINTNFQIQVKALVMNTISNYYPKFKSAGLPLSLNNLTLADPFYSEPGNIDILLGADVYHEIILDGIIKDKVGPLAQRTQLGWILSGPINADTCPNSKVINTLSYHSHLNIDNSLRKFWELEEVSTTRLPSPEDNACESYFQNTHRRSPTGRYIVKLPFKSKVNGGDYPVFQNSDKNAQKRFCHSEQRTFPKNPRLKDEYCKFMQQYFELDHMRFMCNLDALSKSENVFILPHHGVWKESSSTTKLRVVFDGSSKPLHSSSLNEELLPGPTLQTDLASVILRWRSFKVVFTSDIEKMFRQILVHPDETQFQLILWRSDPSHPLQVYDLQTVTYGTTCAPYLAIRVLQQLANDEVQNYPIASEILKRDIYVDDIISGADDIESAKEIQTQLKNLLLCGGFKLRKWSSNSPELLTDIPSEDCELAFDFDSSSESTIKSLGLYWNPHSDHFLFKVSLPPRQSHTKRSLLSDASKLFDPLGWLAPTIILAKIYFQRLWRSGTAWDDPLPHSLQIEWETYRNTLHELQSIKIPRWLGTTQISYTEIHGFCDASNVAYSAVLYCRTVYNDGTVSVNLIIAKTKVAPIKQISLPRLELCGALLLSKLYQKYLTAVNGQLVNPKLYFWTDSMIVLAWLNALPIRWKTFVANRVSQIQDATNIADWYHVRSEDNPADCASRGLQPRDLQNHPLWWSGPKWLSLSKSHWPKQESSDCHTTLEQRTIDTTALVSNIFEPEINYLTRFSSLNRLLRVTVYVYRIYYNYFAICVSSIMRPEEIRHSGTITSQEIQFALSKLIRISQLFHFGSEIKSLKINSPIYSKSKLLNLHPFIDDENILRVGGRLRFADIDEYAKYPIILSNNCNLSKLIVADSHFKTLHGGPQQMMAYIRQKYWILNLRNLAKSIFHTCNVCIRFNKKRSIQLMGSLPKVRVNETRPFRHSGVDYAGPFDIRMSKGRTPKTYKGFICVFICLVTKAIHIELVSDISSEGFIAAFRRFTGRRGSCSDLYSDCGTNFVGANKELMKMNLGLKSMVPEDVRELLANDGTTWHFIPPASPHFGGLWEAGVKSVKYHLKRIILNRTLTFEEMYTLLIQIESSLNSRPLCPLSDDPTDLSVLTPAHFLIGEPTNIIPEPTLLDVNTNRLSRWQHIQQMYQHFWERWRKEFLTRLQQRPKWTTQQPNFKVNDIVIITDERYPPAKWPLARIIQIHPGPDNICRVVSIFSNGKTFKRPITKLRLLPHNEPHQSTMDIYCNQRVSGAEKPDPST